MIPNDFEMGTNGLLKRCSSGGAKALAPVAAFAEGAAFLKN
jgi:hypothetical protein